MRIFSTLLLLSVSSIHSTSADVALPKGTFSSCPFTHEDSYDVSGILETLKAQIATKAEGKNNCQAAMRSIFNGLSTLQDFTKKLDPAIKQKITRDVYQNAIQNLQIEKARLEASGDRTSDTYLEISGKISTMTSGLLENGIDIATAEKMLSVGTEAYYRNELLSQTSNLMTAYSVAVRTSPDCINMMGGWNSALSGVLGAFSIGTSLSLNPATQAISAVASASAQFVSLLQDTRVRKAYNEITRMENSQTLACTYYSLKRSACDYQRAYNASLDHKKIRAMWQGEFKTPGKMGEYERYFFARGAVATIGETLQKIMQMGSPLTLDTSLLSKYLDAKVVSFDLLPPPPPLEAKDPIISAWLIQAKNLGINFSVYTNVGGTAPLKDQLESAIADRDSKLSTITAVEALILSNVSFLDLKRLLPGQQPIFRRNVAEMLTYFNDIRADKLLDDQEKITIQAGVDLLGKVDSFLAISINDKDYEELINTRGKDIFDEVAKGSVAQVNKQSVLAIASRGQDRLYWSFDVIRNAFLRRDKEQNTPVNLSFGAFQIKGAVLADLKSNYQAFAGAGLTFREDRVSTAFTSFEKAFRTEMLDSIERAMDARVIIPELRGVTAAHLCALYASSLQFLSKQNVFGSNRSKKILDRCLGKYKQLEYNRLVTDRSFPIDYENNCTYMDYNRQLDLQNLEANLN